MSTAILISSSPPVYARDPTPVNDSPARKPRSFTLKEPTSSPKRFKTATIARDGFASGFSSARSLLAVKPHAENLPLNTPGKERFKSVVLSPKRHSPPFSLPSERRKIDTPNHAPSQAVDDHNGQSVPKSIMTDHEEPVGPTTPLASFHETVPRRLDWTPAKDDDVFEVSSTSPKADVRPGLMSSFGFKATAVEMVPDRSDGTSIAITKRQRIELIEGRRYAPVRAESVSAPLQNVSKPAVNKKSKAAPKKVKTITDLVTSHHSRGARKESPMAEFLVATQAKTRDAVSASEDNIEVATRGTKRKAPRKKLQTRKRPLLSPTSAIKAFDQQETLFGSASQLISDRPRSCMELSSDPVSPLRTQPTSVGSITPHTNRGSSRFVNRRNLWGAADRDEDNALLYVDSVDLFDTPPAQIPLAGKAVLLGSEKRQHGKASNLPVASESNQSHGQSGASLSKAPRNDLIADVDDFSSPAGRRHHDASSTVEKDTHLSHSVAAQPPSICAVMSTNVAGPSSEISNTRESSTSARPKPSYAGMQTDELQKLIKGYGFKAIKSRQKMVDLLNKCWHEKEARRLDNQQQATEADSQVLMKQSDFISNVHDLSNRPVPKTKKATRKAKEKAKPKAPPKEPKAPKESKKRQKASVKKDSAAEPKKPRGRKPKVTLSEERVLDVDDIDDDSTTLTTIQEEEPKMQRMARSPSPAISVGVSEPSRDDMNEEEALARDSNAGGPSDNPARPDIGQQIYAAILHQSEQAAEDDSWSHVRSPTWHEKILMYDPIIIEDLARWLNAEGLDKIHEDREVTTVDVRDWCESKGVCCMWKGGWRGQASKGGTD